MTQTEALKILKTGTNVFLTGEPGSGKTHTINNYVDFLRRRGIEPAITASTGIAATHINGRTIHSWSGIGINKTLSEAEIRDLADKATLRKRIENTSVLIIDEISMLDAVTLNLAEAVIRAVKKNHQPWGGLQVVFVGDFFQLPPVNRVSNGESLFAFHSQSWQQTKPIICYLEEQYRQQDDKFLHLLGCIRRGEIGPDIHELLHKQKTNTKNADTFTKLFSHNVDVDNINENKLNQLQGKEHIFNSQSFGAKNLVTQLKKSCLSPEALKLKVGARVMFTKNNFEKGYSNGTLGEVVKFNENNLPIVKTLAGDKITVEEAEWKITDGSRTLARLTQLPLRLAWAITVHKSQGMTLDGAVIDLSGAFEFGQGYVALSRVRTLNNLCLLAWNERALQVHPEILAKDQEFQQNCQTVRQYLKQMNENQLLEKMKSFISSNGGHWEEKEPKNTTTKRTKTKGSDTYKQTLVLYNQGLSIDEIAQKRGLKPGTIISHIEELCIRDQIDQKNLPQLLSPQLSEALPEINRVFNQTDSDKLAPVFAKLKGKYSYDQLRLARLLHQK